jgi:hypothetical protein
MNWFKKHADSLAIISIILLGFRWADSKFEKINDRFSSIDSRIGEMEKDLAQVKMVLIIRGWLPESMAKIEE